MKIIVLGAGLIGAPMAIDLAKDSEFAVSVADVSSQALSKFDTQHQIKTIHRDLSKPEDVKALVDGFEIDINGVKIRPIDLTSRLLFPKWEFSGGDADMTVLRVTVEGAQSGQRLRYTYDLIDHYDPVTGISSMARTTGYTATVAVRLLTNGMYSRKGLSAPEHIGRCPECVEFLLNGLKDRGVVFKETIDEVS